MLQQIILHDCVPDFRPDVERYWDEKAKRIERLLARMPDDQRHLRLTLGHRRNEHEARCVLAMPTGTLVATASSPNYREALDLLADRLAMEVHRHMEQIRRDRPTHRERRRAQALA
jgi:ribosome-associated translation inhibitor RaiA